MVKKFKDSFRDKTIEKLCNHLVRLGIDAKMVEKEALEDIGKTSLFTPFKGITRDLGSIRVIGKEIDVIQVNRYSDDWGAASYEIDYAVKGHIKGKEESVKAKTELKTKGLIRKKVLDIRWTGGEIAELLNEDQSLKELMLQEQLRNIEINPDKKRPYVRIRTGARHGEFPAEKAFECYDKIAKHIRKLLY